MIEDYKPPLLAALRFAQDYIENRGDWPVFPSSETLEELHIFDEPLPSGPSDPEKIVEMLHSAGSRSTTYTTGGRYFGFVSGGVLPAALAANWLAGTWDQNAGYRALSPIAAKLEDVAARWLLELFDLPRDSAVGFVTGSTMGIFSSLAAARAHLGKRLGCDIRRKGLKAAPEIRILASDQIHPSNIRALTYLGFGVEEIEWCPTDEQGRLIPDRLPELDDRSILLAQAGQVNSGAFDPIDEICDIAQRAGTWVHVDAAFGIWARTSESRRYLAKGLERADSINLDGHKWLNVPMDSGVYFCRHGEAVFDAFGVDAPYLVRSGQREPSDFTPELGRRARGVEIWAALKSLGRSGIENLVDRCCGYAVRIANDLSAMGFDILNDVCLNQVVFCLRDETKTRQVLEQIQSSEEIWVGPTVWRGQYAMRLSFCSWALTDADMETTRRVFKEAIEKVGS